MHLRRAVTNESPLQIVTESRSISAEEAMNSAKTRRGFLEILKEDNYEFIIQPAADITQNYEEAEAICKDQGGHVLDFSEEEITWQPEEEYKDSLWWSKKLGTECQTKPNWSLDPVTGNCEEEGYTICKILPEKEKLSDIRRTIANIARSWKTMNEAYLASLKEIHVGHVLGEEIIEGRELLDVNRTALWIQMLEADDEVDPPEGDLARGFFALRNIIEIMKMESDLNINIVNHKLLRVAKMRGRDGTTGAPGAPGPMGIRGPTGQMGVQGRVGPDGRRGPIGPPGLKGRKGDIGEEGNSGPVGPQGPEGSRGQRGRRGEDGPQGVKGESGEEGAKGVKGAPGITGSYARISETVRETLPDNLKELLTREGSMKTSLIRLIESAIESEEGISRKLENLILELIKNPEAPVRVYLEGVIEALIHPAESPVMTKLKKGFKDTFDEMKITILVEELEKLAESMPTWVKKIAGKPYVIFTTTTLAITAWIVKIILISLNIYHHCIAKRAFERKKDKSKTKRKEKPPSIRINGKTVKDSKERKNLLKRRPQAINFK